MTGRDEWLTEGRALAEHRERDQWALGDWVVQGERRYGDLLQAAAAIGIDYGVLRNLATVARKVEESRRRDSLSWSHHAAIAALPVEVGDALLDRAEAEEWSREVIREEAREASEVNRLRLENQRLRRALADAGTAKAAARRLERQVKDGVKATIRTYQDMTAIVREGSTSPALAALHGNARNALAARLAKIVMDGHGAAEAILGEELLPAIAALDPEGSGS